MIIGITGKYCSGKSTLSSIFARHGFVEINLDAIGHEALHACEDRIVKSFGKSILLENARTIDRTKLASLVFSDLRLLARLENIVHPWMRHHVFDIVAKAPEKRYVLCAALLHKMKLDSLCQCVIVVHAPLWIRLVRARSRDRRPIKEIFFLFRQQRHLSRKKMLKSTRTMSDVCFVKGVYTAKRYEGIFARHLFQRSS